MALIQLAKRTGSTPQPDYKQMVMEDIMGGMVNGETAETFFPSELYSLLPSDVKMSNKEIIAYLKEKIGKEHLIETLIKHFFTLGKAGEIHADTSWGKLGLDPCKRTEIGLALQSLLIEIDTMAEESGIETFQVDITISNEVCVMTLPESSILATEYSALVG